MIGIRKYLMYIWRWKSDDIRSWYLQFRTAVEVKSDWIKLNFHLDFCILFSQRVSTTCFVMYIVIIPFRGILFSTFYLVRSTITMLYFCNPPFMCKILYLQNKFTIELALKHVIIWRLYYTLNYLKAKIDIWCKIGFLRCRRAKLIEIQRLNEKATRRITNVARFVSRSRKPSRLVGGENPDAHCG